LENKTPAIFNPVKYPQERAENYPGPFRSPGSAILPKALKAKETGRNTINTIKWVFF
jgi:hypothetical protein